ncbi:MAG TPA: cyclic nucleotide-binding domain-containing protein, partial [Geminicoccaceae bacterium]
MAMPVASPAAATDRPWLAVPPAEAPPAADQMDRLLGIGMTVSASSGQTIVLEGDPLLHCYRVLSGSVRLYKAIADGRRQVIDFLGAGDCFGLLGNARFGFCAEAMTRVVLARHPRRQLQTAAASDAGVASSLFGLACAELERMQRQMLLLGRKSAEEKIASFLIAYAARQAGGARDGLLIRFPMSRQDMADYLGLTIET